MTTNIYDSDAGMVATDSRWSVAFGNYLIYLDDAGFEKIERCADHVFMFAGLGERVQQWKGWLRSQPTDFTSLPPFDGMAVCMVKVSANSVVFKSGVQIERDGALIAGTGSFHAWGCWSVNRDARRAVETAKTIDMCTGGDVKYFDVKSGAHNLCMGGADVQYSDLLVWINERGLAMKMNQGSAAAPAAPYKLKELAASNDELREVAEKIASGELKPCAPCDGMANEWTDEQKEEFKAALAIALKFKSR